MTQPARKFTVCVLLYGDYPQLAKRCLNERLLALTDVVHLRVAMNQCCDETRRYVQTLVDAGKITRLHASTENRLKYPVIREMLYGESPISTPYMMWFDDDSYLIDNGQTPHAWLSQVAAKMESADMIGSKYSLHLGGQQHEWVKVQPWYRENPPVTPKFKVYFATGGWWTVRVAMMHKYNWPIPELKHRGGDSMLGLLMQQQGLALAHFRDGVGINADMNGKESASPRRGHDEVPIGTNYRPPRPADAAGKPRPRPRFDLEL